MGGNDRDGFSPLWPELIPRFDLRDHIRVMGATGRYRLMRVDPPTRIVAVTEHVNGAFEFGGKRYREERIAPELILQSEHRREPIIGFPPSDADLVWVDVATVNEQGERLPRPRYKLDEPLEPVEFLSQQKPSFNPDAMDYAREYLCEPYDPPEDEMEEPMWKRLERKRHINRARRLAMESLIGERPLGEVVREAMYGEPEWHTSEDQMSISFGGSSRTSGGSVSRSVQGTTTSRSRSKPSRRRTSSSAEKTAKRTRRRSSRSLPSRSARRRGRSSSSRGCPTRSRSGSRRR